MATTIQSGRASSPLLTADVASRAEVYGGRGLVFDGAVDYLDCGYINDFAVTNNVSVSLWFNASGIQGFDCFFSQRVDQNNLLKAWYYNNYIIFETKEGGTKAGRMISWTPDSSWHHVVFSFDTSGTIADSKVQIYLDGELPTQTNIGGYGNAGCTESFRIGSANNANYFTGKMSDFKVFKTDSPITLAQVQELYLKPENTPSAVQDSLLAWYPMSEANPESPQSIVYDHSEKGLSSEKFGTADNDWNVSGSYASINNGVLSFTGSGVNNDNFIYVGSTYGAFTFATGKLYKLVFTVANTTGGKFKVQTSGNATIIISSTVYSSGTYTFYLLATSTHNGQNFQIRGEWTGANFDITNISLKEVLMGNHATTNFFGDDLLEGYGNFSDASKWSGVDNGFSITGDKLVAVNAQNNIYRDIPTSVHTIENGKSYQATFTISDYVDGYVKFVMGGNDGGTLRSGNNTYTETITVTNRINNFIYVSTYDSPNLKINNFTVKEVGISSTGFTTAQNEPVIPQIPLVKYNEKMYGDGIDNQVNTSASFNLGKKATLSVWVIPNRITAEEGDVDRIGIIGSAYYTSGQFHLGIHDSSRRIFWSATNATSGYWDLNANQFDIGKLSHLCLVYDTSQTGNAGKDSSKLYVNGVYVGASNVGTQSTTDLQCTNFNIGNTNKQEFSGLIDEVNIWNHAFSETEIQELFSDGVALDATTHSKSGNLLGYWRNDGVTTWQDRRGWSALTFDSTDYIDCGTAIGDSLGDSYSNDLTLSIWFNLASTGTTAGIFQIGDFSGAYGAINLFYSSAGALYFRLNGTAWTRTAAFSDLGWNHVAVIYDANSQSDSKIYLNGVSVSSGTAGVSGVFPSSLDFNGKKTILGSILSATHPYNWEGDIKSIGLYNVVKSQSEIEAIYNAGINSSEASNSGIINYWELDNASTIKDLVGSSDGTPSGTLVLNDGNDGSVQGTPDSITIREGLNSNKDGLGFPFETNTNNVLRLNAFIDGEKLVIPHAKSLSIGADFTLEAWVKLKDLSDYRGIVSKRSGTSVNYSFFVTITGSDDGKLGSFDGSSEVISNAAINDNNWHHVAQVHSGTTTTFYIDGDASGGGTQSNFAENTHPIEIGSARTDSNDLWDGLIDEVKIYNRALSVDEVNKNYKHQKGKHKND